LYSTPQRLKTHGATVRIQRQASKGIRGISWESLIGNLMFSWKAKRSLELVTAHDGQCN
jgi:hypothetical protein